MTQQLQKKLSDNTWARWLALFIVSLTMMFGYFVTDVMSPLEKLLTETTSVVYFDDDSSASEKELITKTKELAAENPTNISPITDKDIYEGNSIVVSLQDKDTHKDVVKARKITKVVEGNGWTSKEYGFFSGSYGFINVFLLMLFFGGLILDKMGIRFTGIMSSSLMVVGALIKYYAITHSFGFSLFGYSGQVLIASLGFAVFGVGAEITGITISKIVVKWFTGKELAMAMGIQVGFARLGTAAALQFSLPFAIAMGGVSASILLGIVLLCIGLLVYFVYCIMDKKEDKSVALYNLSDVNFQEEDEFKFSDLGVIFKSPGFWVITLLCLMFYGAVFPFIKFATNLMINKYGVADSLAGTLVALLPYGTIVLTPIFGIIYDRLGKGATLMLIGSILLTLVHILFAIPSITSTTFVVVNMIVLGITFSLVPSAMWPSIPKIIPMKQLGSAYAIIFYIQNIGLSLIPLAMGYVLNLSTTIEDGKKIIDYTYPMGLFALFGAVAVILSLVLIALDKKKGYGLQKANVKKKN